MLLIFISSANLLFQWSFELNDICFQFKLQNMALASLSEFKVTDAVTLSELWNYVYMYIYFYIYISNAWAKNMIFT